jgi:uncharacterized membrane protein YczE
MFVTKKMQTYAAILYVAVVLIIWGIGIGAYLTADIPNDPFAKVRSSPAQAQPVRLIK